MAKGNKGNTNGHKVGVPIERFVEDVVLQDESYGEFSVKNCRKVDHLGDGLCSDCWDKKVWQNPWRTNVYGSSVKSVKQIYK